jgi:hypothetical protein
MERFYGFLTLDVIAIFITILKFIISKSLLISSFSFGFMRTYGKTMNFLEFTFSY